MPSVAEIVAAATQLSPGGLRELCQQIVSLGKKERGRFKCTRAVGACRLICLDDGEFITLIPP